MPTLVRPPSSPPLSRATRRWLTGTLVVTIGSLVCAALCAPRHGVTPAAGLAVIFVVSYSTHVASTLWLARFPEVRTCARAHRVRYLVAPPALVAGAVIAVPLMSAVVLQVSLGVFFAWQLVHYTKQNLGIASLSSVACGSGSLRRLERRSMLATGWCAVAALIARPSLLGLSRLPACPVLFHGAAIGFAVAVLVGMFSWATRPSRERPVRVTAIVVTMLLFPAPMFLVHSPFGAIGGMTMAHGVQYMMLLALAASSASARRGRRGPIASLVVVAAVGGAALHVASHLSKTPGPSRMVFGLYLGLVAAHFVIDAGLWRLRDPLARRFVHAALPDLMGSPTLARQPSPSPVAVAA